VQNKKLDDYLEPIFYTLKYKKFVPLKNVSPNKKSIGGDYLFQGSLTRL